MLPKINEMTLYSYKMTNDSGFAPNPFYGHMTLATCKPEIRKNNNVTTGVCIAGFTSRDLYDRIDKSFTEPRMVFLMKVTEKISFKSYWNDPRFQCKKPPKIVIGVNAHIINNQTPAILIADNEQEVIKYLGDNIYQPVTNGDNLYFIHHDNISHPCKYRTRNEIIQFGSCKWQPCNKQFFEIIDSNVPLENYNKYRRHIDQDGCITFIDLIHSVNSQESVAQHDLKGLNVLISNHYFYFGNKPIDVVDKFKINVPHFMSSYGEITEGIEDLWLYLNENYEANTVLHNPHCWPEF